MSLSPTDRVRPLRDADGARPEPRPGARRDGGLGAAPTLTVLVAADGREKTRLLAALADGGTPDAVHAARRRNAGAPAACANGGGAAAPPADHAGALLAARLRLAAARAEEAQLRAETEAPLAIDARHALRLASAAPEYRAGLLQLAATRARLAGIERTIAAAEAGLAAFACAPDSAADALPVPTSALLAWQERVCGARTRETAADADDDAASAQARRLGDAVRDELGRDAAADAPEVDRRWRRLWRLRRDLEEIWEVQSRAEGEARALIEHEAELHAIATRRRWRPSRRLLRCAGAAALAGPLVALYAVLGLGQAADARDGAIAAALIAVQGSLWLRSRVADGAERRQREAEERQRALVAAVRWRRDRDWSRAARLTSAIEAGAAALDLPPTVTMEALEAHEHALADDLRRDGGATPLTTLLLALLDAEERAEQTGLRRAAAAAARSASEREWTAWRDAAGIAAGVDAARIGDWLEIRRQLVATGAARAAEGERLARLEPTISAWEDEARALLAAAGQPVASELCGRALTTAVLALARRLRAMRQRERRATTLAAELRAAEAAVAAAEAGCDATASSPTGAASLAETTTARVLAVAGSLLAHATDGAYTGLRPAPNGGVLVLDRRRRPLPLDAMPERAGRRCLQFLLRLGEALVAPPRLLVLDDALATLDDEEAATVARAIGALAATRPLVYVTATGSRARALRLLPATARVLD